MGISAIGLNRQRLLSLGVTPAGGDRGLRSWSRRPYLHYFRFDDAPTTTEGWCPRASSRRRCNARSVPGNDLGMAYFDLQDDLERLFGRRVDLVAKDGLHKVIRDQVLADAQVLYAA